MQETTVAEEANMKLVRAKQHKYEFPVYEKIRALKVFDKLCVLKVAEASSAKRRRA